MISEIEDSLNEIPGLMKVDAEPDLNAASIYRLRAPCMK